MKGRKRSGGQGREAAKRTLAPRVSERHKRDSPRRDGWRGLVSEANTKARDGKTWGVPPCNPVATGAGERSEPAPERRLSEGRNIRERGGAQRTGAPDPHRWDSCFRQATEAAARTARQDGARRLRNQGSRRKFHPINCAIFKPRISSTPGPNWWISRPCWATRASAPPRFTPTSGRRGWSRWWGGCEVRKHMAGNKTRSLSL